MLRKRNVTIGQVSRELGIDLNRLYNSTTKQRYSDLDDNLTLEEMRAIHAKYLPDKDFEEVFKRNEGTAYEFDTVSKREAGGRFKY